MIWPAVLLDDENEALRVFAHAITKTNRELAARALSMLP